MDYGGLLPPHHQEIPYLYKNITQKIISLSFRGYGTQNDRLEPTVSMQKSVPKVLRYQVKCVQIHVAKPNL